MREKLKAKREEIKKEREKHNEELVRLREERIKVQESLKFQVSSYGEMAKHPKYIEVKNKIDEALRLKRLCTIEIQKINEKLWKTPNNLQEDNSNEKGNS